MKVLELAGAQLDYWAGRACGYEIDADGENRTVRESGGAPTEWHPSTNWAHGWPIIEDHKITIRAELYGDKPVYFARAGLVRSMRKECGGDTHLVAAMRAFVASKYGETVPEKEFPPAYTFPLACAVK